MQIAIIDDSSFYATGLKSILNHYGFDNIIIFQSGGEALDYLSQNPLPDAFLVDYNMPEMLGPEVIKKLRELYPQSRIIGMSTDTYIRKDMLAAGANAFVSKDCDPDELCKAINGSSEVATSIS